MWHKNSSNMSSMSNGSSSSKRENVTPIFTGYYGMPNPMHHDQYGEYQAKSKNWPRSAHTSLFSRNCSLYQKAGLKKGSRNAQNRNELYEKYRSQKRAENDFYQLQAQLRQTESLVATNPHLIAYYGLWIQQAKETLKEYANIIESPDAVSFSVRNKI